MGGLQGLRLMEANLRRVDACLGAEASVAADTWVSMARARGKGGVVWGGERLGRLPNSPVIYT